MGLGSFNIQERPASRMEINSLEVELEERVRLVLDTDESVNSSTSLGAISFQPHKEAMSLARERMLSELNPPHDNGNEPWLDTFIKCECLKITCDEISSKFSDMLSVSSYELGNVLRKLRLTYKQSFEQMNLSWKSLRSAFLNTSKELGRCRQKMVSMKSELDGKEVQVQARFHMELKQLQAEREAERAADKDQIAQAEFKMDQMNETLKYLNGIFKTMQSDTSSLNTVDLQAKCFRLEKENKELAENSMAFENIKTRLAASEQRSGQLQDTVAMLERETASLTEQLARRDEVIRGLMEREALRNAEIEKLQKISKIKETELESIDLKDPATSVLCIKCKKSLDDLSNIRSAVLGDGGAGALSKTLVRLQCENYRILLPNLKGRQPNRTIAWLRTVVRCILICKMREDLCLFGIKGQSSSFPAFTYSWLAKDVSGLSGAPLTKTLFQADEDRWGLYYGIKALTRENDPEAMIFWSLLDETFGEDGCQFVVHCLSTVLSLAGSKLWRQLGPCLYSCSSINDRPGDDYNCPPTLWLEVDTAKEAVRVILVRALGPHVVEAIEAIDALKVRPEKHELAAAELHHSEADVESVGSPAPESGLHGNSLASASGDSHTHGSHAKSKASKANKKPRHKGGADDGSGTAPTHINLFMWLRLMLQQLHADQIHRAAAIRLMFETASVGALTPAPNQAAGGGLGGAGGDNKGAGNFVEYPQFQSICQTLFPSLSLVDIAALFADCHDSGRSKVTAEVFVRQANRRGYFSQALKLAQLPLLAQHIESESGTNPNNKMEDFVEAALLIDEAHNTKSIIPSSSHRRVVDRLLDSNLAGYTTKAEKIIRSKLATLVHRKLAMTSPSIRHLIKTAPHKWSVMLQDAIEAVYVALNDSHQKMVQKFSTSQLAHGDDGVAVSSGPPPSKHFIDGIQPFISYRKLIVLASFVKVLCDNPLLPTELFSLNDVDCSMPSIDVALYKAEVSLSGMEHGVVSLSQQSTAAVLAYEKYKSFDEVRRTLIARRIQLLFKRFLTKEVAVPRTVRMHMAPGYLCQANSGRNNRPVNAKFFVKNRDFYHEPWWGQLCIAEVYRFKLLYDMKAACLGLPPISLPEAVMAHSFRQWGCMELAERAIQDLFVCIRAYRGGLPRLRMFAAFLGDGRELDDTVAEMLRTPHAVTLYLNLLLEVHLELQQTQRGLRPGAEDRELRAMGVISENEQLDGAGDGDEAGATRSYNADTRIGVVQILFPSTEDTNERQDKREVWFMEMPILVRVLQRWCHSQQTLTEGNFTVYTDLVHKLKTSPMGKVEVDDFLWITMIQWAKLTAWSVKRIASKSSAVERGLVVRSQGGGVVASGSNSSYNSQQHRKANVSLPPMQLTHLRNVVESIYPASKQQQQQMQQSQQQAQQSSQQAGQEMADSIFYAAAYVNRITINKANLLLQADAVGNMDTATTGTLTGTATGASFSAPVSTANPTRHKTKPQSHFSREFDKLLTNCVLWDMNSNLFHGSHGVVNHPSKLRASATVSILTVNQLDGDSEGDGRRSFARSDSGVSQGSSPFVEYRPAMLQCPTIVLAANPALSYAAARKAFINYQSGINTFIAKVSENSKYADDPDVGRRVQTIRLEILTLTETFQLPELENKTHRIYAQDTQLPLSKREADSLFAARADNAAFSAKCWVLFQNFITAVADLVYAIGEDFPRDQWTGGVKIHLDRAYVYSIHTKSSIS